MHEELLQSQRAEHKNSVPHYYGDIIRNLCIIAGLAILITLPVLKAEVPVSVPVSILLVLAVGVAAGLTSPHHRWIMAANVAIALCGVVMFEYAAVTLSELWTLFFWTNQFLAVVFFVALYYSAKSLRGAKTFAGFYQWLLTPQILPVVNFVNEWGLTLLGISLILGIFVRLSSLLGAVLMLLYYLPILDLPYPNPHSYLIDEHIIYLLVLLLLASLRAGRIWGLENWCSNLPICSRFSRLRNWLG